MIRKSLATAAIFLAVTASAAFGQTISGTISDQMCAGKHVAATKDDMACAQKCVKGGEMAVLVVGDKTYKIDNQDAVKNHIGHKVNVTGTINGDTIHIEKVSM